MKFQKKSEWLDDHGLVACLMALASLTLEVHVRTCSPYSSEELPNCKSLNCYINFGSGWIREALMKDSSIGTTQDVENYPQQSKKKKRGKRNNKILFDLRTK